MDDQDHLDHIGNLMVEFGEDYFDDYDDEALAFAAFLMGGDRTRTEGALAALTSMDTGCPTEASLRDALEDAGLCVLMTEGSTPYRDFVGRLRGWLASSLADPESQRRPLA